MMRMNAPPVLSVIVELYPNSIQIRSHHENGECREVSCLLTYSGGFICSFGVNSVYVLEQQPATGEEIVFRVSKKVVFPRRVIPKAGLGGYHVKCLSISPGEDLLVALTDDLLLYSYQLKKKEGSQQVTTYNVFARYY